MKVLLVNKFFYRKGGSETYFFTVGDALESAGNTVIYFSMQHDDNLPCAQSRYFADFVDYSQKLSPLQTLRMAAAAIYSRRNRKKFDTLLRDEKPDVVHVNNIHKQITLSILDACKRHNVPVVATSHDWTYVCPSYLKLANGKICEKCQTGNYLNCLKTGCVQNSRLRSLLATIEAYFYKIQGSYNKIDMYITPSKYMTERMSASGFTKSPIEQMFNCLLTLEFPQESSAANPRYLAYFGRLSAEKGVSTLMRAYGQARPDNLELYIIGDGPMRGELETFRDELGLADRVHITGAMYGDELTRLISRALAVVAPSECLENCPYSVMEALAMGKPVIGSRLGGIPELVADGETGICFEAGNCDDLAGAISRMSAMPKEEYSRMSANARQFAVKTFSKELYIQRLLEKYEAVIKKKGTPVWD